MVDDEALNRYAQVYFVDRVEAIHAEHGRRMAAIANDYAARGFDASAYMNALQRGLMENAVQLARAYIESLEESHRVHHRPIDGDALHKMEAGAIETIVGARQRVINEVFQQPEAIRLGPIWRSQGHNTVDREIDIEAGKVRREFELKRMELEAGNQLPMKKRWDVFLSHASEDKNTVVRPLSEALTSAGVKVWLDSSELTLGDSLRQKIDEGLRQSRHGVVVLSPSFFAKRWPQYELDALFSRESTGEKVILPVLHAMTQDELVAWSPLASGKLNIRWEQGLEVVVAAIVDATLTDRPKK